MKDEPERFDEFWKIWRPHARKTDGRAEARSTYGKHLKRGASADDMIDGARYFIRSLSERDRDYIPLASTWLNRGAYEDMGPMEREFQARASAASSPAHMQPAASNTAFLRSIQGGNRG